MEFATNIRNIILSKNPKGVLNFFINSEIEDKIDGHYFGTVISNTDPTKKGRCRIRVYNLFPPNISDTDIPWAIPDFSYMGSIKGAFIVPPVNTKVRVYFDREDIYCPIYEAKGFNQNDLPDGITTNYPDTMIIYSTDQGEYFSVNRSTKETKFHQASGIDFKIKDGKFAIGKTNAELLDILNQVINALLQSVVPTPMGPQQLSKVTDGTVLQIQNTLSQIKGTL